LPNPGFEGEIFYVQENHSIYYWNSTVWVVLASSGGITGGTIYSGYGPPIGLIGVSGDFYIDLLGYYLYGPKVGSNWGVGVSLVGPPGSDGAPGARWYVGAGLPSSGLGINGDFYLNSTTGDVYEKIGGSW
jgi:hypothetical protein